MIIHQCIAGFTQNVHTLHGVMKLSERIRQLGVDGVQTRILLNTWCSDWKKIAEYYWILSEYYLEPITICVYAYSWGAGWGAMQLARHLNQCGLEIQVMVLSDPVYRHPHWWMRWLAMVQRDATFSPIIKVPSNVHEIFQLHQKTNRPQAHKLLSMNGTLIHPPILIDNTIHQKMDDCWKFHALALEVVERSSKGLSFGDIDLTKLDLMDYHRK